MALRGFDDRGAGAALHAATGDSFKVSGVFRDAADFCVLMLYDADNFYEHPRLKYLPDFDFSGMALQFDVHYEGLQPIDSDKFPTIDWPFLDVVRPDGSTERVRLFDYAELASGDYTQASAQFTLIGTTATAFDRVTLWYQNFAFDYIAAGGETMDAIAQILVDQINAANYGGGQEIEASRSGATVEVRAKRPGRDGNFIAMYAQASGGLSVTPAEAKLSGGSSDATWRVGLDFTTLGLDHVRQMWLTFAPAIADWSAYAATEWVATFTGWTVTGNKWLKVAGPGSVRVEETDAWCTYSGTSWSIESGFYSKGFSRRASEVGDTVTVRYSCQGGHDLWLGTSLYTDRGIWGVSLDGDAETDLDCYLVNEPQVNTRRLIRANLPAGEHTVTLRVKEGKNPASSGTFCYFDFLEAAILSDVPDALSARAGVSPAMDYGTDHTYKPPPARLMWWMDRLGFAGPLNVYVSVFWWNQRKRHGAVFPQSVIDFTVVSLSVNDQVFVQIADAVFGKTILAAADASASVVATHFAHFINGISVGVWAEASGGVLTLTNRAVGPAYNFTIEAWTETPPSTARTSIEVQGSLQGGELGLWVVDTEQTPALNRGALEWLKDLLAECKAREREITLAYSMELLNPPEGEGAWASRYPDGTPVLTATGFADNQTTHCAFNAAPLAYHKQVYMDTADLMAAAGLPVVLQFGEFLWWFFNNASPPTSDPMGAPGVGMAFYDAETQAAAQAALGRPLHVFTWPDDDPAVHGFADAEFLRSRIDAYCRAIRDHVRSAHPAAELEMLLALDVNYPRQAGFYDLGGRLNHYVNIPPGWLDPAAAPFDRVKMEALDWQVGTRSTDLSRETMRFPYSVGVWPRSKCKFLIGLFNGGAPWERAYMDTRGESLAAVNFWAHDHVHIFGWPVEEPVSRETVQSV